MVEKSDNFLDPSKVTVTTLLLLAGTDVAESEYTVACEFLVKKMNDTPIPPEDGKWTRANILSTFNCGLRLCRLFSQPTPCPNFRSFYSNVGKLIFHVEKRLLRASAHYVAQTQGPADSACF